VAGLQEGKDVIIGANSKLQADVQGACQQESGIPKMADPKQISNPRPVAQPARPGPGNGSGSGSDFPGPPKSSAS
jgi:hypothetical protein